ncbi:MAG: S9 family peptidase [Rhodopirellula sp.]|nr:S9 family peptidase [Rhodopirellula sp.]
MQHFVRETALCRVTSKRIVSAITLYFAAILFSAGATAADDTITPLDVARMQSVVEQAISPDGKSVAYTVRVQRDPLKGDNGPAWTELRVVDSDSGKSKPFITGKVSVASIAWTPDGTGVTFLAKRGDDKNTSIYVIPIDGGEARKLIEFDTSITDYDWKADGKQIAFLAKEKEDPAEKKLRDKGFNAEGYEENLKSTRIWIADAEFGSDKKARLLDVAGSASELHWSPDGKSIAVAIAPTPLIDHHFMYRRIRVVNAETAEVVHKFENPGKIEHLAWSPDSSRIAFLSGEDINDPGEGRLLIATLGKDGFLDTTSGYKPDVIGYHWVSDSQIRFLAHNSCLSEFGSIELDGGSAKLKVDLQPTDAIFESFSMNDAADTMAMIAHSPSHLPEVFIQNAGQNSARRLTDLNPWLKEKRLAKQEIVTYTARDGQTVEGVLIRPLDEVSGKKYPLQLFVHGGPESHVSNGWVSYYSYPGQTAAANGYAVFHPNYRGSTGRGIAFAKDHQADYGGKEFDDLLDGVDHLVKSGLVDRAKVGITGGSYGGFASAWCATKHSEHFAAAVMFVGISNQISKSGTTDIADEMFHVHARKRIWDDWEFFLKRSPIYYVEKARTPILILHGKEDTRVHPSQSMELYRNLKILGKTPVRLVLYPGEGHGNRNAAARYDYSLRLHRWMDHYLKGKGGAVPPFKIDHGLSSESDSQQK